eukprot:g3.t1
MSEKQSKDKTKETNDNPSLDLCEEDDEFEEFEDQDWGVDREHKDDKSLWQNDWDDEVQDEAFTAQLRAELKKTG